MVYRPNLLPRTQGSRVGNGSDARSAPAVLLVGHKGLNESDDADSRNRERAIGFGANPRHLRDLLERIQRNPVGVLAERRLGMAL
jgi:hypothetical protein